MSGNVVGNYALGNDIDASATSGWNAGAGFDPVGSFILGTVDTKFKGSFDGLGHVINGLTINRPTSNYVGLFGFTSGATLRNVGLPNASIAASGCTGTLVGYAIANSVIDNSYGEGGSVNALGSSSGGLAGCVSGVTISNSHAAVAVTGVDNAGGLVGLANSGSIANSYASGNVSSTGARVGGLVGQQAAGAISNSYASANVSSTSTDVGGLVGLISNATATVSNSYATGTVSGTSNVGGLVGSNALAAAVTASF